MTGIVTKSTGSWCKVRTEEGIIIPCRLRGQFRIKGIKTTSPVVVGDHVTFSIGKDNSGYITHIEPRTNYIERKSTNLSKISHLIAANIDLAFLVITLKKPRTSLGFINRFLIATESYRIPVCLIFNKTDLYNTQETAVLSEWQELYESIGYQTLKTSVPNVMGIEKLKTLMHNKVSLLSGHSGTGKSALVNAIDPSFKLKIGAISGYHDKGMHTTTFAQMFSIPSGGDIIDTPGIKEFGLIQYSKTEIRDYFPEIRAYNNCCKFQNCLHIHEPECAVRKATEEGKISPSRYANYLAILQDEDLKIAEWQLR
ncbi:MAG: ribosome small subunit-dependent GTPase A [Bacteroidales bacterium]|jgi:ribosome biogenesis GTPase|nr:ribosome small subunit-dependent GTPase A [Bacteroidales bacterium]